MVFSQACNFGYERENNFTLGIQFKSFFKKYMRYTSLSQYSSNVISNS